MESALRPGAKLRNAKSVRQICEMCVRVRAPHVLLVGQDHTVDNRAEGEIRGEIMVESNDQ
jgi:hypothetical protein